MTSREAKCLARRYAGELLKASAARAESKFTAENGISSDLLPDFWREVASVAEATLSTAPFAR